MFNVNRFCKALYELDPLLTSGLSVSGNQPTEQEQLEAKIAAVFVEVTEKDKICIVYTPKATEEDKAICQELADTWESKPNPNWYGFYNFVPLLFTEIVANAKHGPLILSRLSILTMGDPLILRSDDLLFRAWNDSPPGVYKSGDEGDSAAGTAWMSSRSLYYIPLKIDLSTNELSLEW